MHPLVRYALIVTPVSVLVFLVLSGFFDAWHGRVVSYRPSPSEEPAVLQVLVVAPDRTYSEHAWPADLVRDLTLPPNPSGVPSVKVEPEGPETTKNRFALSFDVSPAEGPTRRQPTTSARALSSAVLLWLLGLALHNMYLSGSPFSWAPRTRELPETSPRTGEIPQAAQRRRTRGRPGPPPPKPRRGQGRRR